MILKSRFGTFFIQYYEQQIQQINDYTDLKQCMDGLITRIYFLMSKWSVNMLRYSQHCCRVM